jgi:hypothetical protein
MGIVAPCVLSACPTAVWAAAANVRLLNNTTTLTRIMSDLLEYPQSRLG